MVEIAARAILFDMDGTLVDSSACVEEMWGMFAEKHGIALADILAVSHGRMTKDTVGEIAPHLDAEAEAAWLDGEAVVRGDGIVALPGARELVATLRPEEWAVVTSAPRALAEARLRFAGLPVPACLIANEDVRAGKPDPDGYLKAAAQLGVEPRDCLVIEDTPAGVLAARAAGMAVLSVGTTFPESELLGACWVPDFAEVIFRRSGSLAESNAPQPSEAVRIVRLTTANEDAHELLHEYYEAVQVVQRDEPGSLQELLDAPYSGMWLAYMEGETEEKAVGCVVLRPLPSVPRAGECKRLYVKPEARGRGIADMLLDGQEAFAREQGLEWIYLDTHDGLQAAIALYERRGYERCERYNDNPQATLFMRKRIAG